MVRGTQPERLRSHLPGSFSQPKQRSIGGDLQGIGGLITHKFLHQPIYLKPQGQSRTEYWHHWFEQTGVVHCLDCGQPLQPLESTVVIDHFTPAQQVAEKLGSATFSGWRCLNCKADGLHIRSYEAVSDKFSRCPNCNELTALKQESRTIKEPRNWTPGLSLNTYECQCCNYRYEIETEIPFFSVRNISSGGGSDFGGGSSGGGGGGGSW